MTMTSLNIDWSLIMTFADEQDLGDKRKPSNLCIKCYFLLSMPTTALLIELDLQ